MKNNTIRFTKIRDVKSPTRNEGDAGSDFYVPEYSEEFIEVLKEKNKKNTINLLKDEQALEIAPHSQILIPAGIKVDILDKTTYIDFENKSGIATNNELLVGAQVIDSIYQGEVHINVHNVSNKWQKIKFGQKLIQGIQKEYRSTQWVEISNEEYDNIETSIRGEGGFGSTGLV
jgi:deoxyuridine 5'-triphosphate nucleotidohydrolase